MMMRYILFLYVTVEDQIQQERVFLRELQLSKVVADEDSIPDVMASWEFRYPGCFTRFCMLFRDGETVIVETCLDASELRSTNQVTQSGFTCNTVVGVSFRLISNSITFTKTEIQDSVYTGG